MVVPIPTIKLSSGFEMPVVGLGTWQSEPGEVEKSVETAVKVGYRLIDCAWQYGNQVEIGKTLQKLFASGVKRGDIFVASKVWNTFHSAPACKRHVVDILRQLQLDYIDLMLIHYPMGYAEGGDEFPTKPGTDEPDYSDVDYLETWKALEECVVEGKIRTIGLSNFNHKQIERILKNSAIKPAFLQIELHPYFQQKKLLAFCKEKGIAVTAYSPIANPGSKSFRKEGDPNIELHPYFQQKKLLAFCKEKGIVVTAYSPIANPGSKSFRKEGDPNVLEEPIVTKIAKAHGKTPAQVVLRWITQQGVAVIPKSTSEEHLKSNLDIFDFELTAEEMKEMEKLDRGWRIVDLSEKDSNHPYFPYHEEY
ncbi:oxidoreductase, aldo/keto reductase family protein [Oesophagostomum dentatum]|uniref:Oxidoreductase, aldo/keto reductase family protein n=1 Tax=Oesophagostomum dentatum TaxID=61180 RepID=A0A0B1TI23_OESDE|nr:oxidoreductase, aldo/keto reductase family protein [Oesophagostomum dentatum]